jgi:hypothetical protein
VDAGGPVKLSGQTWEVTVPASVLQTGINLKLLKAGDTPAGTAVVSVFASHTKEGARTSPPVALAVGPITLDAGGLALPAKTSFAVPDMTWTAVGGEVAFAMQDASIEVAIGPLKVMFTCAPKDPSVRIVTAAVRGTTDIPPASRPGTQVLGETTTRTTSTQTLPRTGTNPMAKLALAVGLIDLGYLLVSAARPARRRLRFLVQG